MESILIPIDEKPIVKTYAGYAYWLSIITKDNKNYSKWMVDNGTLLQYYFYNSGDGHSIEYYDMDCPFIDQIEFPREDLTKTIKNKDDFILFLYDSLRNGYCLIIELNEYYLPGKFAFNRGYYVHSNMIYGINIGKDTNDMIFNVIGYGENGYYHKSTASKDQLYNAYTTNSNKGPYALITKLKLNPDMDYKIDPMKMERCLKAHFENDREKNKDGYLSQPLAIHKNTLFYRERNKEDEYLYGIDVMKKAIDILYEIKNGQYHIDIRFLSVIMDNKYMMLYKLKYFAECGFIFTIPKLIERQTMICEKSIICFNSILKYRITNNTSIMDDIAAMLQWIIEEERLIYPQLLSDFIANKEKLVL